MRPTKYHKIRIQSIFIWVVLMGVSYPLTCSAEWQPTRILGTRYPREAIFARIQGVVEAKCDVKPDGSVGEVRVLSGHPVLARSVKENLRHWRFRQNDKTETHPKEFFLNFNFKLDGSCEGSSCKEEFWIDYPNIVTVVSEVPYINPSGSGQVILNGPKK